MYESICGGSVLYCAKACENRAMKVPINRKRKRERGRARGAAPLLSRSKKARREFELLGGASISALTIVIVLMFGAGAAVPHYAMRFPQVASVISSVIVDLTNGDRMAHDLSALKVNPVLVAAAQAKADHMAALGYFAHTAPDGTDPWHWFDKAGYEYEYAGENLAIDFSDSAGVERAWMNSPTHRENILNAHFTEIGIATAIGMYQGRMTTFVVQAFASPKTQASPIAQAQTAVVPKDPQEPAFAQRVIPVPQGSVAGAEARAVVAAAQHAVDVAPTPEASSPQKAIAQNATHKAVEDAVPVEIKPVYEKAAPAWAYLIGVPHQMLWYLYYALGLFILAALAYTTRFELRKHHIRHATGAGFLIGLMGTLLFVAHYIVFTEPVLAAVGK